ncbi:MAG: four helix bundle protein [Ginsengibacter sp.]
MKENIIKTKTFDFALSIISLYKQMQEKKEYVISKQLLRSSTSIGANVEEADAGQTKKDFISKMSISAKEARETHYWLRLLQRSQLVQIDYASYIAAIEEIIRILTSIIKTAQNNINGNK